jgi:SAM-dependent methyltransferase
MNRALRSRREWQTAAKVVCKAGLTPHPDTVKNWDHLAALHYILSHTGKPARVLDAGGLVHSPLVGWLSMHGYTSLHVINLSFEDDFTLGTIQYIRGDCARTPYPNNFFDIVACLSVVEHGVSIRHFLNESHRILRPGGSLIISTDYWGHSIATMPSDGKIFTPGEIRQIVECAISIGFEPTGAIDYETNERTIKWESEELSYTFIIFALIKK